MITVDIKYNKEGKYHELVLESDDTSKETEDKMDTILACIADAKPPKRGAYVQVAGKLRLEVKVADLSAI